MIKTKKFYSSSSWSPEYKELVMKNLNRFIWENGIERSNILEFRTDEKHEGTYKSFEVVISWWQ